ncbi:sce7725 family protein [Sorangium sp. So ce204]|uniref:sce7725 family protein n=1 Tax=Sorangium sp. So ce204 TaxID=3133288 RepID=UPI003F5F3FD0
MYFPLLRGKLNELLALRELAPQLARHRRILPIIEPVNANATARLSLDRFAQESMRFMLLLNPRRGELANDTSAVQNGLIRQSLSEYDNYIPAMYVDASFAAKQLDWLNAAFGDVGFALVYDGQPADPQLLERLAKHRSAVYHVFLDGNLPLDVCRRFPAEKRVLVKDRFKRAEKNAKYPADDFFTDMHLLYPDDTYAGFGDYSIVGAEYLEDGGPAHAVALHHVYRNDNNGGNLHVRHFVSDRTDSPADIEGKFLEALTKLVGALPLLGEFNHTPTCDEYLGIHSSQQFKSLGYAKRMAIKHHLEVMLKVM